ncbi:MAG: hypothetical protein ACR2NP_05060 [Pirellulaceae bacterium]
MSGRFVIRCSSVCVALILVCSSVMAQEHLETLTAGQADIAFAGPLAFGPDGVLFVGDPKSASVFALDTGDRESGEFAPFEITGIDEKLAAALGTAADQIVINDLAVNPISGVSYLSVSRGSGPDATAAIVTVASDSSIDTLDLKDIPHAVAELPNPPAEDAKDRRGRPQRILSITDISLIDNQVVVAGLTNEDFASNLRAIPYPFAEDAGGTALEVYHGAHGAWETHAPVRTFAGITLDDEPYIVAAYTCTPLVRFPLSEITSGDKIRGTTVAELGNRNRPLDMFVYKKDGEKFILMANSHRGMMKISTSEISRDEGIAEPVRGGGTEGQTYDTLGDLEGTVQLDRYGPDHALLIVKNDDNSHDLKVVLLP